MTTRYLVINALLLSLFTPLAHAQTPLIEKLYAGIDADADRMVAVYKDLHQNPELGFMEVRDVGHRGEGVAHAWLRCQDRHRTNRCGRHYEEWRRAGCDVSRRYGLQRREGGDRAAVREHQDDDAQELGGRRRGSARHARVWPRRPRHLVLGNREGVREYEIRVEGNVRHAGSARRRNHSRCQGDGEGRDVHQARRAEARLPGRACIRRRKPPGPWSLPRESAWPAQRNWM